MLQQLVINDLAVIDSLNINFNSGMTVLTGETGAGKSILLDALGLILGNRADTNLIRGGTDKTDITAVFSISDNEIVSDKLIKMELAENAEDELYVRRTITKDGRSRAYLNNTPVPVQTLKEIGENLIDIHGQHTHQSLSKAKTQRELLDQFGSYQNLLNEVQSTYREWKQVKEELDNFITEGEDFEARLTLLRYQIEELEELNIGESEYEKLLEEHKRQSNSQRIFESCQSIISDLSESETAIADRIALHQKEISELCRFDNKLENINNLLDSATIQIEEASHELKNYLDHFDMDTNQLKAIESRLDKLHELARKHKVKADTLPEHLTLLTTQRNQLEGGQEQHEELQKKKIELTKNYFKLTDKLTKERKIAADKFSKSVTEKMHELAIAGIFKIDLGNVDDDVPHQYGMDKISFLVSTNPGQPLRSITKVASGGELSRLSLAIQIIGSKDSGIPTLIFDEIDAGISGSVAEIVGRLLHRLAEHRQILCVTHLAQVASCGHHHLSVNKTTKGNETYTQVKPLDQTERINEVARLLAGMDVTDESLANAAQMLKSA